MSGEKAQLIPPLQSALAAIHDATQGMTHEELCWRPSEGKWSAAEILEHLSLAYSLTAERMKPLLDQNPPAVPRRTFKQWLGVIVVLKLGYIPSGRKAPEGLVPRGMSGADVRVAIEERLFGMDRVIRQCEERFGKQAKILVHGLLGPLCTGEWRKFHCVHTLHHMKQIQALRKNRVIARDPVIR